MLESVDKDVLSLRSNHASRDFLHALKKLRDQDLFTDITLEASTTAGLEDAMCSVGDVEPNVCHVRAHRLVLCACSPYFDSMFAGGGDFEEQKSPSVRLVGVAPDALILLVDFMYTGALKVNHDNVCDVLQAADLLLMEQESEGGRIKDHRVSRSQIQSISIYESFLANSLSTTYCI
jgi:hypothetical protein